MATLRSDLRRDGSTAYRVFFRHAGEQTCLTFDDPNMAALFRDAVGRLGAGNALKLHGIERRKRNAGGLTVAEWLDTHIGGLTGVEQYTLDKYREFARNDIAPILGAVPLAALTEAHIGAWVAAMQATVTKRGAPPSAKTIQNKHGFLSGALAAAVRAGHLTSNPAAGRRLPKAAPTDGDDMRMLTHDEFAELLAATPGPWKPLIEFMVASGARWGEVSALTRSHVDVVAGTVRIRQAWKHSSAGYQLGAPKTRRSRRVINVPPSVLSRIDHREPWLFVHRGGPLRYPWFRDNVWDVAVKGSRLSPAPTPHDLRHTCASWMLAAGVPVTVVSRHLGHESIQITVDVYGDVDRSSAKLASDAMHNILNGNAPPGNDQ